MTTIVGDWNTKVLVSDSQFSDDDTGIKYFDEKIVPIDGGWLGVAGNWSDCEKVVDYINKKSKTKPKLKADSSFIRLTKDGLFYCGDDLEWELARRVTSCRRFVISSHWSTMMCACISSARSCRSVRARRALAAVCRVRA